MKMKNTEYEKIEPESFLQQTISLRKKVLITGLMAGIAATSIFGYNFFVTNKYIDKDFSKSKIEEINSSKQSKEFPLNTFYSISVHNPVARYGRNLAYSLREEEMNERERFLVERGIRIGKLLEKIERLDRMKRSKKGKMTKK